MNAHSTLTPAVDVDLTAIMERDRIVAIKSWLGGARYSVELDDGRFAVGHTVGEALEKALARDAFNVRRAA